MTVTITEWIRKIWIPIMLATIGVAGLVLRLIYVPLDIPFVFDSLQYFWYANDVVLLGALPSDYSPENNGWPIFLSLFFQMVDSGNYLDYMLVQRLVGASLSVLTMLPTYVICRRFVPAKYALVGPAIFVLEPRIAANSITGMTEPLFILLTTTALVCFLNDQKKIIWLAFPALAFAAMVRGEGVVLIVPFAILYAVRFRHSKKTAYEVPLLILLFLLILTPMIAYRIDVTGHDSMFMRIQLHLEGRLMDISADQDIIQARNEGDQAGQKLDVFDYVKWTSIPIIVFLIPYGMYKFFWGMKMEYIVILTTLAFMSISSTYLLVQISFDPRYAFVTVPILCIFCSLTIQKFVSFLPRRNIALITMMGTILVVSFVIIDDWRIDAEYEAEKMRIAEIISEKTKKINYMDQASYLPLVGLEELEEFPILKSRFESMGENHTYCAVGFPLHCDYIIWIPNDIGLFKNLTKDDITHIILDSNKRWLTELENHIFENENEYPFLIKIYDSRDHGFRHHVKIFEIDHDAYHTQYSDHN